MSSRRQRSNQLGGRYRQVSLCNERSIHATTSWLDLLDCWLCYKPIRKKFWKFLSTNREYSWWETTSIHGSSTPHPIDCHPPRVHCVMMMSSNGNHFHVTSPLWEGNPSVPGGFPSQRPVTRSFDVFFDMRLNKRLNKQLGRWWFETPSRSLWCHCNVSSWTVQFPSFHSQYTTGPTLIYLQWNRYQ